MTAPDWVSVTLRVIDVLDKLEVRYLIGGSVASIVHGIVRTTLDSDLIAELELEHVEPFVAELQDDFYLEPEQIRKAIVDRSSFNVIDQKTMFKVDIFIAKSRPFDKAQLDRRVEKVFERESGRVAWFASPEDTILAKLEWFRLGGEVSERQWRDILGVLRTREGQLDMDYLQQAALTLHVDDLLAAALDRAGTDR